MKRVAVAAVLLALLGVAACGDDDGANVPDEAALRVSIEALYTAEQAGDWRSWFDLTAQARDALMSYEEFTQESGAAGERRFSVVSWKVIRVERVERKAEETNGYDSTAKVVMDVTVRRTDRAEEKEPQQTDYWFHADGRWYWGWRGFPSD